ncbi:hypothetical protein L1987_31048 [Smallanthus sonchifolius]|uniref:Uncharacterized protein n=1 Tax=Smallanthus sonchifolius TaxID=185202 RepID=A0ACB9I603_9ASTR|nr:hypothetical protein L1987_31048 [Smallanthus sonchifolius]
MASIKLVISLLHLLFVSSVLSQKLIEIDGQCKDGKVVKTSGDSGPKLGPSGSTPGGKDTPPCPPGGKDTPPCPPGGKDTPPAPCPPGGKDTPPCPPGGKDTPPAPCPPGGKDTPPCPPGGKDTPPAPSPPGGKDTPPCPSGGKDTPPTPCPPGGKDTPPCPPGGKNTPPAPCPPGGKDTPPCPPRGKDTPPAPCPSGGKDTPPRPPGGKDTPPAPCPPGGEDTPPCQPGGKDTPPTPCPPGGKDNPPCPPGGKDTPPAPCTPGGKDTPPCPPGGKDSPPAPCPPGDKDTPPCPPGGKDTPPAPCPPGGKDTPPCPSGGKDTPPAPAPPGGKDTPPCPPGGKDTPPCPPGGKDTLPAPCPPGGKDTPPCPPGGKDTPPCPPGGKDTPPSPCPPGGRDTPPCPPGGKDTPLAPCPPGGRDTPPCSPRGKDTPQTPCPPGGKDTPPCPPGGKDTPPAPTPPGGKDTPPCPPGGKDTPPCPPGGKDTPLAPPSPGGKDTPPAPPSPGSKDTPPCPPGGKDTPPAPAPKGAGGKDTPPAPAPNGPGGKDTPAAPAPKGPGGKDTPPVPAPKGPGSKDGGVGDGFYNPPLYGQKTLDTDYKGQWIIHNPNVGVNAMQYQLMANNKAVWIDTTNLGPSARELGPKGNCPPNPDNKNEPDCFAHGLQYDVETGEIVSVYVRTDPWCSSGHMLPNGDLISTGGNKLGDRSVRLFSLTGTEPKFTEREGALGATRWYASNCVLEDGSAVIVGGRDSYSYDLMPPQFDFKPTVINLPFLQQTTEPAAGQGLHVENNLYPFVYLIPDGNVFIFANNRAIRFNPITGKTVKEYPVLEGGSRNYPTSGQAALLPLRLSPDNSKPIPVEVVVCGGNKKDAFVNVDARYTQNRVFSPALADCNRIKVLADNPIWEKEQDMPSPRTMGDLIQLPNGQLLLINGAKKGTSGWDDGEDPNLTPTVYMPENKMGKRFKELNPTTIPRMYHSVSSVLPDGKILVAGSNAHQFYTYDGPFPTELRVEKFSPHYLDPKLVNDRPVIKEDATDKVLKYGKNFKVTFTLKSNKNLGYGDVLLTLLYPPFTTHGFSQNQRLLITGVVNIEKNVINAVAPPSGKIAPPGYYLMFVNNLNIPSRGIWVHLD